MVGVVRVHDSVGRWGCGGLDGVLGNGLVVLSSVGASSWLGGWVLLGLEGLVCSNAGGVTVGTLCSGAGGSGAGSGGAVAVARFKLWAIWMYALVMLEP